MLKDESFINSLNYIFYVFILGSWIFHIFHSCSFYMLKLPSERPLRGNTCITLNNCMLTTAHAVLCRDEDMAQDYSFGFQDIIVIKEMKDKK